MFKLVGKLIKNVILVAILVIAVVFGYKWFFQDTQNYTLNLNVPQEVREQKQEQIKNLKAQLEKKNELSDAEVYELYNGLGIIYFSLGEVSTAIDYYKKANALIPKDSVSLDNIGNAYAEVGEYQKAKEYFQQAIDLTPYHYYLYQHLIDAQKKLGYGKEVVSKTYEEALNKISVLVGGNPEQVLIEYARYLESQGDYQGALSKWQTILLDYYNGNNPGAEEEILELQGKIKAQIN